MDSGFKPPSFWYCDGCYRTLDHGEFRYNCSVCGNYDQCETCVNITPPIHPHPLIRELAFGEGVRNIPVGPSMASAIHAALEIYCDRHCLGVRDMDPDRYLNSYSWQTYKTVGNRVRRFAHGLRYFIQPRDYLGICAANRPEWVITDLACMLNSIISVPIYCLMSDRDTAFVLNNTKISIVVCEKETLPKLLRLRSQCPALRQLICMDSITETMIRESHESDISIYDMNEIERINSDLPHDYIITQPTDCLTVIYTSGSSDFPKGVIISDRAFRAIFEDEPRASTGEFVLFCYQPLSWYGGRNSTIATLLCGGRAGFSTGDVSRLMEELALVRPTLFAAPPNIWNKIYAEFQAALASATTTNVEQNQQIEERILEQFSKLIPARCTSVAVVGALISPTVLDFLRRCFRHANITDAYGITECGGLSFGSFLSPNVAYRLESVPEMGFTIEDKPYPRGELLTKTPQIFSGYVNNPAETRAALTDDGYFRTGDIVEFYFIPNQPGAIRIIDRKKNFVKLSHGQFISPEYLQGIFTQSSFIEQIYVHGDPYEDTIMAVIVPNQERAQAFANENDIHLSESDPKLYTMIMSELRSIGTKAGLQKHEIPSRIVIDFEPFTTENGLLTSSMKPCRPKLAAHYKNRLKSTESMEQRLKTIVESVTGQSMINDDTNIFLTTGGNSLTALRLSRSIQENLGTIIPISVLFEPQMNLQRLTALTQNPSLVQDDSFISRLFHDAELELNLSNNVSKPIDRIPLTVFITGTTGFVGAFLLAQLLAKYPISTGFICLVRCEPSIDPLDRIRDNLRFYHLWDDRFHERILAVRGDLAHTYFGLDQDIYRKLNQETDMIFHCGAMVNFVLPYSQLYGANVLGTREILRFATYASTRIPIQYISTISVLPPGINDEIPIEDITPYGLTNGYAQTKWVAEKLMAKAHRLGLPVAIYRLGSMCADTRTGACNPLDLYTILLTNLLKIRCYPSEIQQIKLHTLPIDFAIENIIFLSQFRSKDTYGQVYHVIHPDGGIIFKNLLPSITNLGMPMESVSSEEWRNRLKNEAKENLAFEFLDQFILDSSLVKSSILSSKQFYNILPQYNLPPMDGDYPKKWLIFILENILK